MVEGARVAPVLLLLVVVTPLPTAVVVPGVAVVGPEVVVDSPAKLFVTVSKSEKNPHGE